jgi:hypothetical protein
MIEHGLNKLELFFTLRFPSITSPTEETSMDMMFSEQSAQVLKINQGYVRVIMYLRRLKGKMTN